MTKPLKIKAISSSYATLWLSENLYPEKQLQARIKQNSVIFLNLIYGNVLAFHRIFQAPLLFPV